MLTSLFVGTIHAK